MKLGVRPQNVLLSLCVCMVSDGHKLLGQKNKEKEEEEEEEEN